MTLFIFQSCAILVSLSFFFIVDIHGQSSCLIGHLSIDQQKCYFTSSQVDTYFDAQNDCKDKAANVGFVRDQASLVSISNAFANGQVQTLMNTDSNCVESFIGLNNFDNGWQWTDGTMFGYSHWHPGCPNSNSEGLDHCVTMDTMGYWCNRNCALLYCYICEIILSNTTTTITVPTTSEHLLIHTVTIETTTSNTSTASSRNIQSTTTELPPSYDEAIQRTSSIVPQQKLVDSKLIKQQQVRPQQLTYPQYNEATLPYPTINQLPQPQQRRLYPQHQPTAYSVQQSMIPQQPIMLLQPQWTYPIGYMSPLPQPVSYVYPNYAFGNYWSGGGCYNGYNGGCGG